MVLFPHERITYADDVLERVRALQPDDVPLPAESGAATAGPPVGQSPATGRLDSPPDPAKVGTGRGRPGVTPTG